MKKMNYKDIPYKELARYIRQEATDSEIRIAEDWINMSDANRQLFNRFIDEWTYILEPEERYIYPSRNKIWQNIQNKIQQQVQVTIPSRTYSKYTLIKITGIAAAITLLLSVVSTYFIKSYIDSNEMAAAQTIMETTQGQKSQVILPDGTKVWLNSGSQLTYTGNFNQKAREVTLIGEAFFEVAKDSGKKFIVKTSSIDVVVTGTSFDVAAYNDDNDISVSLLQGSVLLADKKGITLTNLKPDERAIVSKQNLRLSVFKDDAETYRAWMHDQLIFYNADINKVAKTLERWYGVDIKMTYPMNSHKRYTFSVKTESLRELLELMNKITPIEYTINGKEVDIKIQ